METKQIINGLLDRADRVADQSAGRIMKRAAKRLEELEQRLFVQRELAAKQQWIPVADRLPKRGADIIVCSHRTIKPVVFTTYFWDEKHDNWLGITHWMPLPEPPKEV